MKKSPLKICENFLCLNRKKNFNGCRVDASIDLCEIRNEFMAINFDYVGRLQRIYDYFGESTRIEKLKEECLEFLEEPNPSEIADVLSVAIQIYLNDENVRNEFDRKLNRTEERIKSGYYIHERAIKP